MPEFSSASLLKLRTCHEDLQAVFNEVIKYVDCTIVCGFRGQAEQDEAFANGKSQLKWPNGKHNKLPSMAIDVVPSPIDWNNTRGMYMFAGFVLAIAATKGIKLRWGGDWDRDWDILENRFNDLPHFEIVL